VLLDIEDYEKAQVGIRLIAERKAGEEQNRETIESDDKGL
jgi:hypothetical protein